MAEFVSYEVAYRTSEGDSSCFPHTSQSCGRALVGHSSSSGSIRVNICVLAFVLHLACSFASARAYKTNTIRRLRNRNNTKVETHIHA